LGTGINTIVNCARRSAFVGEKLLVGIDPKLAARKPRFETVSGPVVIDTNHPTFVFGHVSLYPAKVAAALGLDTSELDAPAAWVELFKAGAPCVDDVAGTLYPSLGDVSSHFLKATEKCLAMIEKLDDSVLLPPPADERFRERFHTIGGTANFLLNNHLAIHLGQVSAWRRCFGLPSAL